VANQEHLKRLLQGVAEWNEWRRTTGVTCPDLSGAQLGHKVLIGANLRRVDLRGAVKWSRLSEQIFRVDKWSLCRG